MNTANHQLGQTEEARSLERRGSQNQFWLFTIRFVRLQPVGAVGAGICLALVLLGLVAPVIATFDPKAFVGKPFEDMSGLINWGTDNFGRDVFSRVMWGARLSLYVGFAATFLGTTAGLIWGLTCGYWGGGLYDTVSQRIVDALMTIPTLILAMVFVAAFPPSVEIVILAIAVSFVPGANRTIRSLALGLREKDYITAARAIGCSEVRILFKHMLPGTMSLYIILSSLHIGGAILAEASLSFLGVGVPPDVPTWGGLVNSGTSKMLAEGPMLALIPGAFISLAVYGFNLFGDSLRDVLDPRLRGSR